MNYEDLIGTSDNRVYRYISINVKNLYPYIKRNKERNIDLLSKTNHLIAQGSNQ